MRKSVLNRSVRALLSEDETLVAAAYMWSRHRMALPYMAGSFSLIFVVTTAAQLEPWTARVGLAAAAAALVVTATSDFRVVALTTDGYVMCRAGRIRQVAVAVLDRRQTIHIEPSGGTMLATEWTVDGITYSVSKSYERSIRDIAAAAPRSGREEAGPA